MADEPYPVRPRVRGPLRPRLAREDNAVYPDTPWLVGRRGLVQLRYSPRRLREKSVTQRPSTLPYTEFKALIEMTTKQLQVEMRDQHEKTRAEVRVTREDILKAVRSSPAEYIRLGAELGMVICLFSLVLRYLLSIEIVRTPFAVFMLFAFAVYWLMAEVKARQGAKTRETEGQQVC